MKFISIDPSLRNTAIVFGSIIKDDGSYKLNPEGYELIVTKKSSNKKIRASSDLIERCRALNERISKFVKEYQPSIVFAETPSGSQSFRGGLSYAVSCYLIATVDPPAIELTPTEVKKKTVGKNTATKKEMIQYVVDNFPEFELPMKMQKGKQSVVEGKAEHICDAICAGVAGLQSNQFEQLRRFLIANL